MTKPSWQDYGTYDESEHARLWDGVVGAWCPSLGPTGSRLFDHSRFSNWGTLTNMDNATDWVVDGGQYALDFDGSNDYIALPNSNSLNITTWNFTLIAWARIRSVTAFPYLITKSDGGSNLQYSLAVNNNQQRFFAGGTQLSVSFTPDSSQWYHFVATCKNTDMRLYRNGIEVGSGTRSGTATSTNAAEIGRLNSLNYSVDALIAETAIYDRALSANEVRDLYLLGRAGMYQRRRRSRRRAIEQAAGFKAYWVQQKSRLIGGGV